MSVSVLILTLNEEQNLPACLSSLGWCDDIVILDSFSSDSTKQIAEDAGVRFLEHHFDDYASQRSYGVDEIDYKYDWLLMVDADEMVPEALAQEIKAALGKVAPETTLYRMRRKDYLFGKWIKRSSGYPTWFGRLMRIGFVRIERSINEEYVTDGKVEYLQNHLDHYPFNKGFSAWLEKHNRYSTMEAELVARGTFVQPTIGDLFSRDPTLRRKAMKTVLYRMPFRPLLVFVYLFVFRMGFLDGKAGLIFCCLRSWYEFMIDCKVLEYNEPDGYPR